MHQALLDLLERQQAAGFPGLAGARLAATLPVADGLLNELIAGYLPADGRIRTVEIRALAGDRMEVRLTLAKPRFLPPFKLTIAIDRQPELPASPELVLKMTGAAGLIALAGAATALVNVLPPGVRLEGDRIHVDFKVLLRQHGREAALALLEDLRVNTSEGTVIISATARIPSAR